MVFTGIGGRELASNGGDGGDGGDGDEISARHLITPRLDAV
jgi:hypothetical protein